MRSETPQETADRMVSEGFAEFKRRLRSPGRITFWARRLLGAAAGIYEILSPGPHSPPPPQPSVLRLLLALLAGGLFVWPLRFMNARNKSLQSMPWAEESRTSSAGLYRGPGGSHPLATALELKPVGLGLAKEYWVTQDDRLRYRLLWPRTRAAILLAAGSLSLLLGLLTLPALSGEPLGDIFVPALFSLLGVLAALLAFRNRGKEGVVVNAKGKILAAIKLSPQSTFFEETYVVLDGEQKPLAFFPRTRLSRLVRKQWWLCPARDEFGARIQETSVAKSLLRRLTGHLGLLRSSFVLIEGDRSVGYLTREGLNEKSSFRVYIDKSPLLPVVDPRAFLALLALLAFVDSDPWHPSLLG